MIKDKEFHNFKKIYFTVLLIAIFANVIRFAVALTGDNIPDMIETGVLLIIMVNGLFGLLIVHVLKD